MIFEDLHVLIDVSVRQRASLASLNKYTSVLISVLVSCCSSLLLSTLNEYCLRKKHLYATVSSSAGCCSAAWPFLLGEVSCEVLMSPAWSGLPYYGMSPRFTCFLLGLIGPLAFWVQETSVDGEKASSYRENKIKFSLALVSNFYFLCWFRAVTLLSFHLLCSRWVNTWPYICHKLHMLLLQIFEVLRC